MDSFTTSTDSFFFSTFLDSSTFLVLPKSFFFINKPALNLRFDDIEDVEFDHSSDDVKHRSKKSCSALSDSRRQVWRLSPLE